ncbi:hypothetical protein BN1221_02001c [Brenneria goodwinii]|uniref:Uncharacterized protein n=1 Tax=Brenneria goodwinii TaxID=1109412 RepID=A0A0G4JUH9_9GAMM|nr:hypothetical protein BN1221_02001c [Brenneria goodwinii]
MKMKCHLTHVIKRKFSFHFHTGYRFELSLFRMSNSNPAPISSYATGATRGVQ